jgi:propanol-preferring alcohol dehydrogenase
VGLAGGTLPVSFGAFPFEARVTIPIWGTNAELAEVAALDRAGRIRAHTQSLPLSDAPAAYDRMRRGEVRGRAVIIP